MEYFICTKYDFNKPIRSVSKSDLQNVKEIELIIIIESDKSKAKYCLKKHIDINKNYFYSISKHPINNDIAETILQRGYFKLFKYSQEYLSNNLELKKHIDWLKL